LLGRASTMRIAQAIHHTHHTSSIDMLAQTVTCSLILSRIDYGNAVIFGTNWHNPETAVSSEQCSSDCAPGFEAILYQAVTAPAHSFFLPNVGNCFLGKWPFIWPVQKSCFRNHKKRFFWRLLGSRIVWNYLQNNRPVKQTPKVIIISKMSLLSVVVKIA